MDSKSAWFNKRIPDGKYKPSAPSKDLLPSNLKDFINKYENDIYIHKKPLVVGTAIGGLTDVLKDSPVRRIRSMNNIIDILIRGYTHDWRIIIYILLTTGFTLWFNNNPFEVPQIEYTSSIIHHGYLYQISHLLMNLDRPNEVLIPSTSNFISQLPYSVSPSTFVRCFNPVEIEYVKESFNQGWTSHEHIKPNELVKAIADLEITKPLHFDPLGWNNNREECLNRATNDWVTTCESHNTMRAKSFIICSGIIILLMTLAESTPGSIAA
jgi:hypothetical protein